MLVNVKKLSCFGVCSLVALSMSNAYADRKMNCSSFDRDYTYCSSNINNQRVTLKKRHSKASCRYNTDWGYDRHGIWTDNGCRATFKISKRHNDNDDDADVLVGALVIGGLIAALASDDDDEEDKRKQEQERLRKQRIQQQQQWQQQQQRQQWQQQQWQQQQRPVYRSPGSPPPWAQGVFTGYDPKYKARVTLNITSSSNAYVEINGVGHNYSYRSSDNSLSGNGDVLRISHHGKGIILRDSRNNAQVTYYRR